MKSPHTPRHAPGLSPTQAAAELLLERIRGLSLAALAALRGDDLTRFNQLLYERDALYPELERLLEALRAVGLPDRVATAAAGVGAAEALLGSELRSRLDAAAAKLDRLTRNASGGYGRAGTAVGRQINVYR